MAALFSNFGTCVPSRGQYKLQHAMVVSQKTGTVLEKFYSGPEILEIVPKSSFRAQTKRPPISPKYILHYLHLHLYILYLYTYILTPIYICRHTFKIPTSTSLDGL